MASQQFVKLGNAQVAARDEVWKKWLAVRTHWHDDECTEACASVH
jgi:hypothetical protein